MLPMLLEYFLIKVQSDFAKKNFQFFDQQSTNNRKVILKKESFKSLFLIIT